MQYVEYLRSRRLLIWWTAIFVASFVLTAITAISQSVHVHGQVGTIPIGALFSMLFFFGAVLASFVAPGLHSEHATLALVWTRPIPRSLVAWRYIAVDLLTIVAGLLVVIVVAVGQLAFIGVLGNLTWEPGAGLHLALAFSCILMWYGLVSLAAVRFPERAGMIAGLSWLAFAAVVILSSVEPVWPVLHAIATALDYLDPFAYFGNGASAISVSASSAAASSDAHAELAPPVVRLILSTAIGIAALVATVRLWSTREI
jgi:hypothetical protein